MLCAHPALSRENAAALTLRLVLGVSTADIARLFLVPTPTMAARLTRVAQEPRRRDVRGAARARAEGPRRARGATSPTWPSPPATRRRSGADLVRTDLAAEAIRLARLLRELLPRARRPRRRCSALMLLQHSRRDARLRDGRAGAAAGPGPVAAGTATRSPRRSTVLTPHVHRARHAVPPAGADRGRARHRAAPRRDRLAPHRRAVRRAGGARATRPSYGSTGPSPSPRPTARWPGCAPSTASSSRATGCPASAASCSPGSAAPRRRAPSSPAPSTLCDNDPERDPPRHPTGRLGGIVHPRPTSRAGVGRRF